MDIFAPEASDNPNPSPAAHSNNDEGKIYLVPFRWWRESQSQSQSESQPKSESESESVSESESMDGAKGIPYTVSSVASSYYKFISIFSSDLTFNLRRDEEDYCKQSDSSAARSYALIPSNMWSHALKWHNAASAVGVGISEDASNDAYTLKLRISVPQDANVMNVKIYKKDNAIESYKRACKIFSVDSETVRMWDFSGRTDLIFMDEWNRLAQDGQRPGDQENLLELQVYGMSESLACRNEGKKDDSQTKMSNFSSGSSFLTNGSIGNMNPDVRSSGCSKVLGSFGLIGLENLGNTCFMNSAVQCLAHTTKLVEYFLEDYSREINHDNPLGMDGEIALAFGELLRKLWSPDKTAVVPRVFKAKLARFAPQFGGFNQHDSQELLAFLLDGLHEDLNRVKCKPYIEVKDACGRPDEEVADEYWANHLARNDSIIVDICQGQYRSTLVCPVCNKVSVTFDPFMYLSLPLPSSATRTMTVTVFSTDGSASPTSYTINVPKYGKCKDLMQSLNISCSLGEDENLLIAEVYSSRILRYLEDPNDSVSLIRDGDCLAAYRILKDTEELSLVMFTHQRVERSFHNIMASPKAFGVPLVARLPGTVNGCTVRDLYLKLLKPFLQSQDTASCTNQDNAASSVKEVPEIEVTSNLQECQGTVDATEGGESVGYEFQYYLTDDKGKMQSKIEMDEQIPLTGSQKQLNILVCWQDKAIENYDIRRLSSLPEIYKSGLFTKRIQEPISLYTCLEAFLKEEPLGPDDMWYCPNCKKHQQASKKLDLWRLPEILVIHLKRFSYSRVIKNKLETFVDFPIHNLDLSGYIAHKTEQLSHCYSLYAISNHYGNMGGGHYTAYIYHEGANCWYDFDDRHVLPISEDGSIKTSAAYVLFYRRVQTNNPNTESSKLP